MRTLQLKWWMVLFKLTIAYGEQTKIQKGRAICLWSQGFTKWVANWIQNPKPPNFHPKPLYPWSSSLFFHWVRYLSVGQKTETPWNIKISHWNTKHKKGTRKFHMYSIQSNCWLRYLCWGQDRNKDADVENGLEDKGRGKGKLRRSERVALTYIHDQM